MHMSIDPGMMHRTVNPVIIGFMNKQYHCKAERNVPDVIYAQFCIDCCKVTGIQKKDKRSCKCEYDGGQDTPVYLLPKLILPNSSFTQSFRSKFVLIFYIIVIMKDASPQSFQLIITATFHVDSRDARNLWDGMAFPRNCRKWTSSAVDKQERGWQFHRTTNTM